MKYVELHARSAFSFLEGASLPEELAHVCAQRELPAMALLDSDGVYGAPRFHMAATKAGIKAHIGAEISVSETEDPTRGAPSYRASDRVGSTSRGPVFSQQGARVRYPLLVESRAGYQNLCRLITRYKLRERTKGEGCTELNELAQHAGGLICLTGGSDGPLAHALHQGGIDSARAQLERLTEIFGAKNVYVELQRHFCRHEELRNHAAVQLARSLKLPIIATNGVHYATADARQVLDVFTCIKNKRQLSTAGRLLAANSERHIRTASEMQQLFADLPDAISNTETLSSRLGFTLADLGYQFPKYPVGEGDTMQSFLEKRTAEGFEERYGRHSYNNALYERARRQIARELALIAQLDLAGYFLIVWDIIRFCRSHDILVQGRGSAANSAVCYALGITAVDPVGMELLFERFLSEERGEWPDIDIDLPSGDQRERVIQYVYQRYGQLGAAMTANVITYRGRSAAREIGKTLGFDLETIDRLSRLVGSWEWKGPNDTLEQQFRSAGFDLHHPLMRKYLELCLRVQDLPRHLGQHSGGMVICQGQLDSVVPLEPASMPGRVVVQWDKDDCADMKIIKVDLLGLGMMAVLKDSIDVIRDKTGEAVDLAHLPQDDPLVYRTLRQADTVGMFQVESRAQMSCLPRNRPENFYDIVVQVALIRPGPIVGNMVNPYLQRRLGGAPIEYAHPSLEPVLRRTLGVPLFQEQLLRMAMIVANFTGGEAEELRRALGGKRSEAKMRAIEVKLRRGMQQNGITAAAQQEIITSITSFALYGFPESHAASFALLAYASAYLKCHYLGAFTAALLNNQPMGFYSPATIVKDAQRHGLIVKPICILNSDWFCTLEKDSAQNPIEAAETNHAQTPQGCPILCDPKIVQRAGMDVAKGGNSQPVVRARPVSTHRLRIGLRYVRGLREESAQAIVAARKIRAFTSIDELTCRVPSLRKNELVMLAQVGALNNILQPKASEAENFETGCPILCDPENVQRAGVNVAKGGNSEAGCAPDQGCAPVFGWSRTSVLRSEKTQSSSALPQAEFKDSPQLTDLTTQKLSLKPHRRDALWQVERAGRPAGPLLKSIPQLDHDSPLAHSPLLKMTDEERLVADFHGTGLTVGPHPMAYRRAELKKLGIRSAIDLQTLPNGKRLKIAGCVICRQRPGTASGLIFLSLEDETGISNAVVMPDIYESNRMIVLHERFLLIEGVLQSVDNVITVRAEKIQPLRVTAAETESHDFH